MAVLVEALSVIVRNATLESLYPGGVSGYAADCPNRTFCSDGVLTRVGFMTPDDVGAFLERLETRGLVFLHDGVAADIAVVDQHEGPTTVCDWLAVGEDAAGIRCCWLRGSARGALATPAGWTPDAAADVRARGGDGPSDDVRREPRRRGRLAGRGDGEADVHRAHEPPPRARADRGATAVDRAGAAAARAPDRGGAEGR